MESTVPRYIIADPALAKGWTHIFAELDKDTGKEVERERDLRFVYDTEAGKLIHLDVYNTTGPYAANAAEIADVEDSLKNANPEALENPDEYGIAASDDLPSWAAPQSAPAP